MGTFANSGIFRIDWSWVLGEIKVQAKIKVQTKLN